MPIHKMLMISTGGTIAGEVAKTKKGEDYEIADDKAFSELVKDTMQYLDKYFDIQLKPTPKEYVSVDSSDIMPEHWVGLAQLIYDNFDDYDSFVITHGTNTLGYTCAALSFALVNPGKPIVLTGSQVPIGFPGSDAKTNLDNAIRIATLPGYDTSGVLCVFGSHIITGTRVKKATEFDYDAFQSFNTGAIGRIGRIIDINKDNLNRHLAYLNRKKQKTKHKRNLDLENAFNPDIVSFTEFPGMDYSIMLHLSENQGIKGFIVRAFGAGDISTTSQDVLRKLQSMGIPVVATTQAPNGNANLQVNEPGQQLAEQKLVIPAFDMNIESQTAKLMWLLAKKENKKKMYSYEQLYEDMKTDMHGEINVIWELEHGE